MASEESARVRPAEEEEAKKQKKELVGSKTSRMHLRVFVYALPKRPLIRALPLLVLVYTHPFACLLLYLEYATTSHYYLILIIVMQ